MNKHGLVLVGLILLASFSHALSISSVNVDPSPVIPGQAFTLYAYVTNDLPIPAKDVVFELQLSENAADTPFPFSIEPSDTLTRSLGDIPGFQTVQVQYRVRVDPVALDAEYNMVLFAHEAGTPAGATLATSIEVSARAPVLTIVQSTPSFAASGETVSLALTVKNTGSSPAQDVLISLQEDRTVTSGGVVVERSVIPLGAATAYIGSIPAGESATVIIPVQVNPDVQSKAVFVPVTLDFYDNSKTSFSTTNYIGMKISGEPELNGYVSEYDPLLAPGKTSRVTIDLFNTGLGPAKFAVVNVSSDKLSFTQTQFFIGTIESDDFDSITLDAAASADLMPGTYPVEMNIEFKNEFGNVKSLRKTLSFRVYAASEVASANGGDFPLFPLLAVIIIVLGVWYFRFRKPKNGNGKR